MLETGLLIIGVFLIVMALYTFIVSAVSITPKQKQKVTLETISRIWDKRKEAVIALDELSYFWRLNAAKTQEKDEDEFVFQHNELSEFFSQHIEGKAFFSGSVKKVISGLMKILDTEGDCSSVVNTRGEPESILEKNAYDVLAQATLLQHTLCVTEEIIKLVPYGPITPKVIIAALSHDLGKIPSYHQKLYSMGDHPLISVTVLEGVEGINEISYKDEVMKAIRNHHKNSRGLLAEKLKEADQNARRSEMAKNVDYKVFDDEDISEEDNEPSDKELLQVDIFGKERRKVNVKKRAVEMPWFDSDEYLHKLKVYINNLNKGRWEAFSMSNGIVYFQAKTLWEALKVLAKEKKVTDIVLADADEEARRNILRSVVNIIKTERNAIVEDLIKDGYFVAPFIVKMRNGMEYNAFYAPFNAEVFGWAVSELEQKKTGKLKEIVDVSAKYDTKSE